jgi:hypothetical protein
LIFSFELVLFSGRFCYAVLEAKLSVGKLDTRVLNLLENFQQSVKVICLKAMAAKAMIA